MSRETSHVTIGLSRGSEQHDIGGALNHTLKQDDVTSLLGSRIMIPLYHGPVCYTMFS